MGLIILISDPAPLPLALASSGAFFLSGTLGSEAQCASEKWARRKRREAREAECEVNLFPLAPGLVLLA